MARSGSSADAGPKIAADLGRRIGVDFADSRTVGQVLWTATVPPNTCADRSPRPMCLNGPSPGMPFSVPRPGTPARLSTRPQPSRRRLSHLSVVFQLAASRSSASKHPPGAARSGAPLLLRIGTLLAGTPDRIRTGATALRGQAASTASSQGRVGVAACDTATLAQIGHRSFCALALLHPDAPSSGEPRVRREDRSLIAAAW